MSKPSPPLERGSWSGSVSASAAPSSQDRRSPSTRYQGSKRKLLPWLREHFSPLEFHTALDACSGTGSVSYLLKTLGKAVTCNDVLQANYRVAQARIENTQPRLTAKDIDALCSTASVEDGDDFIARTFAGIYFTDAENVWLDAVCQKVGRLEDAYPQAVAFDALFQACLKKRPYNLFHRRNLYLRTADVQRGFGNKASWDAPFPDQFRQFAAEIQEAVFDSGVPCRALCGDAADVPGDFDLVYLDPPYISRRGVGVDYFGFYHFLEGLTDYPNWAERLDRSRKHLPLLGQPSAWSDPRRTHAAFSALFARHPRAILAVSYRSDGIPTIDEIAALLKKHKRRVAVHPFGDYTYALSTNRRSQEVLLIGR